MLSLKTITFCKNVDCPASHDLLAFEKGETTIKENDVIQRHLESCEFCAAEAELYAHFPQNEENVASVEIPLPLFQLAEALLNNRHKEIFLLNKLLGEAEETTIKSV